MRICVKIIAAIFISCIGTSVYAQFGFSGGLGYGFPSLTNRQGFNNNNGVLGGLQFFYQPRRSKLFPSLNFHTGLIQLPVKADNYNDLNVTASKKDLSLNLNFRMGAEAQYFIIYAGAGLSTVTPDGTSVQENGTAVSLHLNDPGRSNLYRVANFGAICNIRISADAPLYLGIEAYLQYLHLSYNNVQYYLDFNGTTIKANITGDYLYPVLLANITYIFEKKQAE